MRLLTTLFLLFSFVGAINGQTKYLELQIPNAYIKTIEEGKRVEVKMMGQEPIFGKLRIVNDSMIAIKDNVLTINKIDYIKKNPLAFAVLTKVLLIGGGAIIIVAGLGIFFVNQVVSVEPEASLTGAGIAAFGIGATSAIIGIINSNVFTRKWYQVPWDYTIKLQQ